MDPVEPTIKVTDRRHFTPDGQIRDESASGAEEAETKPAPPVEPSASPRRERLQEAAADPAIAFASFILSLGAQAASLLDGEEKDLDGARHMIGILEMLKDKTEGRRTEDESRILDGILYDLRLGFVSTAKGSVS
jgi:hypothetical protein